MTTAIVLDHDLRARLDRLEMRQEALIAAVNKLAEVVEITNDSVGELLEWAHQPVSSDLPDALAKLIACVDAMHDSIVALGRDLPGRVAEAMQARQPA
jgi:hypothetical protein